MSSHRKLALMLLVVAAGLAVAAARSGGDGSARVADGDSRQLAGGSLAAAGLAAEERALRAGIARAAATKPLLAALDSRVDAATLVDLLASASWWRDVRSEFQLSRIVVGAEVLATQGTPELGVRDREVVAQARRAEVASGLVAIDGRSYALVAARLSARPAQAPVLVLAKSVRLAAERAHAPARVLGAADLTLSASALLMALAAAGLLVWKPATPLVAARGGPQPPPANAEERDLNASGQSRASVPPPPALPAPPVPKAHARHLTAPDGTPVALDGSTGQRFGRYQLLNRIGEGGMSEVFTAMATGVEGFSRVFVLKRLRPELSRDKDAVAQFIDEARMQASLVHSNIVPVFDFGRVGDEYFMTQEYIVGRDLSRVVAGHYESRHDALSARLAQYIALETLLALHYAHTRHDKDGQALGLVHRDVSPSNVILSAEGEVKLADFGIVKSNKRITQTQAGMVKGNANFMSPEQARGHQVDARSDVFSVGLVLFYCLTNRLAYHGDNDLEVLYKAASGPTVGLQQEIDALPSPTREALGRALALDPGDRFQSAAEFADVLAPHIAGAKAEAAQLMKGLFGEALLREAA